LWAVTLMISFSEILVLVCKNATNFCTSFLCPTRLRNLSVLMVFWWSQSFPSIESCPLHRGMMLLLPSSLDAFYLFLCLTVPVKTSTHILDQGGETGCPCFAPEEVSAFPHSAWQTLTVCDIQLFVEVCSFYAWFVC
jgi:hypothetical protein